MDNVTHAFAGAAIAECALPPGASARARAVFMCAGIVAANAPDVDLLYTGIIEEPLGYLLHHRGHSHTVPGMAALGMVIYASLLLVPYSRSVVRAATSRMLLLIAAALVSHLLLDSANSYGTHPFYPFSSRWFYGDAVFVLEPWLWAILGATIAVNAGRVWRAVVAVLTIALMGALLALGLLQTGVLLLLLGAVTAAVVLTRTWDRRRRAAGALIAIAAFAVAMSGLSRVVKAEAREAAARMDAGRIIDVIADANPGAPWCWTVLTLQDAAADPRRPLIARRATLSLMPSLWPASSCASARLSTHWSTGEAPSNAIVWHRQWRIDVEALRALAANNCRVNAWLQFGRVPDVVNGSIVDLRFENPIGQNFTPMVIDDTARGCPAYPTHWTWPRIDVLGSPFDQP